MSDTYAQTRATVARLAKDDFAKHEVRSLAVIRGGEWVCKAPGTGICAYTVICRPCYVIVYGDLGDWVLQHSDRDSLGWVLRISPDVHYLVEKIRAGDGLEFYPADALEDLRGELKSDDPNTRAFAQKFMRSLREELGSSDPQPEDMAEHHWHAAYYDAGGDEAPRHKYPGARALWLYEALRFFAANLPKGGIIDTDKVRAQA